jgi:hypothetical protein
MSEREQLNATSGPISKRENAKADRVLRDDELDAVSGASSEEPTESISFNYRCRIKDGLSNTIG